MLQRSRVGNDAETTSPSCGRKNWDNLLQRSRVGNDAETGMMGALPVRSRMLQRSRVGNDAETPKAHNARGLDPVELQRSRVGNDAETIQALMSSHHLPLASTEPRRERRGDAPAGGGLDARGIASTEPRRERRGDRVTDGTAGSQSRASTEPRRERRGDCRLGKAGLYLGPGFNGAASGTTRRLAHKAHNLGVVSSLQRSRVGNDAET